MADGAEMVFGFPSWKYQNLQEQIGIIINDYDEIDMSNISSLEEITEKSIQAHKNACEEMGFVLQEIEQGYLIYQTPEGLRNLSPFSFEVHFEGEDGCLESSVFGISITSRYFPTFVDWKFKHGGMGIFTFSAPEIEIAKKHIINQFSFMKNAELMVICKHY